MLGLIQLCLLLYIRKHTIKSQRIDIESIRQFAKMELSIKSVEQTDVTLSRLKDRGFIRKLPTGLVAYIESEENETILAKNVEMCDRAVRLSDAHDISETP